MVGDILLYSLLKNPSATVQWSQYITADWFENHVDGVLWKEVVRIIKATGGLPSLAILRESVIRIEPDAAIEEIESRIDYLSSFEVTDTDLAVAKDILKTEIKNAAMRMLVETSAEHVSNGRVDAVWDLADKVRHDLEVMFNTSNPVSIVEESELIGRIMRRELQGDGFVGGTLIHSLDRVLRGGLRRGSLSVVLGVTSIGKTMFLIYLGAALAIQGLKVLYISLEDTKDMIDERFDALLFGRDRTLNTMLTRRELIERFGCQIYTEYVDELTVSGVKAFSASYAVKGIKLDAIIIDYGDLMKGDKKTYFSEHGEYGDIFQNLMKYAEKSNEIIISASQATREGLDKKYVTLKHTGGAYKKVQVAHYVFALCQTAEEEEKQLIRIVVLKHKFGKRNMTIPCSIVRGRQHFKEVDGNLDRDAVE